MDDLLMMVLASLAAAFFAAVGYYVRAWIDARSRPDLEARVAQTQRWYADRYRSLTVIGNAISSLDHEIDKVWNWPERGTEDLILDCRQARKCTREVSGLSQGEQTEVQAAVKSLTRIAEALADQVDAQDWTAIQVRLPIANPAGHAEAKWIDVDSGDAAWQSVQATRVEVADARTQVSALLSRLAESVEF